MTIVMEADDDDARRIEANLYKLVNVLRVDDTTQRADASRASSRSSRCAPTPASRPSVMQVCEVFRARVIDVGPEALICEITGTADKIDGLVDVLMPFGIVEMVRTGAVAMVRSAEAPIATATRRRSGRARATPPLSAPKRLTSNERNKTMTKIYYDKDADLGLIRQQEGRHHRLRLAGPRPRAQPEGERRRGEGRPARRRARASPRPRPPGSTSAPSPRSPRGRTSS